MDNGQMTMAILTAATPTVTVLIALIVQRQDIRDLRNDLQGQIVELRNDLQGQIAELRNDIQRQMVDLRNQVHADLILIHERVA